ncbi:hypothetical protein CFC21_087067 [Triticum aestivum]|uniref:Uncharacterized protein n=2 Tax=Triticum aestivum TaxID=4565 RepID=A0A3B6PHP3_WHEAT|nr:uncharacterized protein LOC123133723 [Triticum aestivum]KAF7083260.1 hypothetical protein CFC21_087067 [Triticum aestivum]
MAFEGEVSRLAARIAASSPARVRMAVGTLARSSAARAAADALVYLFVGTICVLSAATFLCAVAFRACGRNCSVAAAILFYSGMLSLLLMVPAMVLFFLRAAGSEVKYDVVEDRLRPWPLDRTAVAIWRFFVVATSVEFIGLVLQICGFPKVSYLLRAAALLCMLLVIALFCIRAAVALWRMNPRQSAAVAASVLLWRCGG